MSALDNLKRALLDTNSVMRRTFQIPESAELAREINSLQKWLAGGVGGSAPPRNRVQEALARFYRTLQFENPASARLVCFGCTEPVGADKDRLIEDAERFPRLLDRADQYAQMPRVYRRCYRGLLSGYFSYDPERESSHPSGKRNWSTLRSYLFERLPNIESPGVQPEWVGAITEHRNLLTEETCDRYGLSALDEGDELFRELRRRLDIADTSWLTNKWFLAQIEAAVGQGDDEYKQLIDPVLRLLEAHPLLVNRGLGRLLTRYRNCKTVDAHPTLREFVIAKWGNPWLSLNAAKWGSVDESTRKMVSDWLKLELIHQFFSVLAEDGTNDTRRLKFWQRYHERIDDMYFALGNTALVSRSTDYKALRDKMAGRLVKLHKGGEPTNNAFIMMMGKYVVVEFGLKGNACFIFERESLPFKLNGYVAGDKTELKHPSHRERLRHQDRSTETWEDAFEQVLYGHLKYRPAKVSPLSSSRARGQPRVPNVSRTSTDQVGASDSRVSERALTRFASDHGLRITDHRDKGGALWVHADDSDPRVATRLKTWGFEWAPQKGRWWKRN